MISFPKAVAYFAILLFVLSLIAGCQHQPPGEDLWRILL